MKKPVKPEETIDAEVAEIILLQDELQKTEAALMKISSFKKFIVLRRTVEDKMSSLRNEIEAVMIPAYRDGKIDKSIKREWGSVTVTESDKFEINEDELPAKFWSKKPNESLIRKTYQLDGKPPKGTKHSKKYGIMIKFK